MGVQTISRTKFNFPGQTGIYHGKVRDVYTIDDKYLVAVATDRISAFDVILPKPIPYKGQVLNQLAAYFLKNTADIVPNWLLSAPDPNVSIGLKCEPFKIEMVIRGCLVGHAWREYKAGKRSISGAPIPDNLNEYGLFPEPIITPATKAEARHDEDISPRGIMGRGLATKEEYEKLAEITRKLFAKGQKMARERGLFLADTKYEIGKLDGKFYVIDEIHTPDSSRYFYADSFEAYINGKTKQTPKHLSKEFVREWLMDKGFSGQAGQKMPELDNEFVNSVSERYIELYEEMTGENFIKADSKIPSKERIETAIIKELKDLRS